MRLTSRRARKSPAIGPLTQVVHKAVVNKCADNGKRLFLFEVRQYAANPYQNRWVDPDPHSLYLYKYDVQERADVARQSY